MTEPRWVKVGLRFMNLDNVTEVHVRERPHVALVHFAGGGRVELDEDDTAVLLSVLEQRAAVPEAARRTVLGPQRGP
jgi:hypothetical protein